MNKTLLSISFLLFIAGSSAMAQTGIKVGLKAGYNIAMQYGIKPANLEYEIDSDPRDGFAGGILLYFPITEAFGVQQEFLYVQKGSSQHVSLAIPPVNSSSEYKINYFELPIIFRYTIVNIGSVGLYGSSGFALSMLLSGEYAVEGVFDAGEGNLVPFGEEGDLEGLDTFDYSFIYGLGVKFNVFNVDWFFDYRQTIGWNTLLMPTFGGEEPAPLRNQSYTLALGMYF